MRYCRYQSPEGPRYAVVELRASASGEAPEPWAAAPFSPPEEDAAACRLHDTHRPHTLAAIALAQLEAEGRLLAPCTPSKIVCVGRNYRDHAAELGNDVPTEPLLFLKPPSALLAPGATVRMPAISKRIDFEGELAFIIGTRIGSRSAHLATDADALAAIRGYTLANDVTARDLQKSDPQWTRGKGFDTFCPTGPLVLTADELDPHDLTLTTRVNGVQKQLGHTRDFIFNIPTLLRYISAIMTLEPGDLILTGTPAGVAPLNAGDTVAIEIPQIGILQNPFAAA